MNFLQGDRFDHADRLFFSMAETWENSLHNTTDVKELTPEFFYQPEFLLNSNSFMLGERQVSHSQFSSSAKEWQHKCFPQDSIFLRIYACKQADFKIVNATP